HGSSKSDVWAAGTRGAIAHFDGKAWTTAVVDATATFRSIATDGADSVWAAGDNGFVWHLAPAPATATDAGPADAGDGGAKTWSKVASGTRANLLGTWRTGAGDLWFVGAWGEILHWKNQ